MPNSFILFALCSVGPCSAQNLVPNGSFEEYTECPPSFGYWANVVGWSSPFTQSADYYNACADGVVCSVPLNTAGYQYPAEGDAYMGIFTYATLIGGFYREVLATELTEPLQPGVPVYIAYKVSPGGFGSNVNNSATWAAKGPGVNFYTELPTDWPSYLFPNSAAVEMAGVLSDTLVWTTITGTYVPDSAYQWLAITNFYENSLSQAELLDGTAESNAAYAFVDDVCVSLDPHFCANSTGLTMGPMTSTPLIHGTLVEGRLNVWADRDLRSSILRLYNAQGSLVWNGTWSTTAREFNEQLPLLGGAFYLLTINNSQGHMQALRMFHFVQP